MTFTLAHGMAWVLVALTIAGVIIRPFGIPEVVWASAGAILSVLLRLLPVHDAVEAIGDGTDVYLFLIGMMLLAEVARQEGLFEWTASHAVRAARGSVRRLFLTLYGVAVVVTALLSNDATAVVLTPAVLAVTRKARIEALPFLFICAMVANAASFVLPISNPANIVLYDGHLPALASWFARFALPSIVSIAITFIVLRHVEREAIHSHYETDAEIPALPRGARVAMVALALTIAGLLTMSALGMRLGLPTMLAGIATMALVGAVSRSLPFTVLGNVSWSIVPLVAGLFVMVEVLDTTGVITSLANALRDATRISPHATAAGAGILIALTSNITNNLPSGLVANLAILHAKPPDTIVDSLLIGIDLGPNLSITGSLATILWLSAIRREGEHVTFRRFLKTGVLVMPPALLLALLARIVIA